MRSQEHPPEIVRLRVDEVAELTVSALERGDLDRAALWLGLVLSRNDPDGRDGGSSRSDDGTGS
jgi:hypothetical protein